MDKRQSTGGGGEGEDGQKVRHTESFMGLGTNVSRQWTESVNKGVKEDKSG